MHRIRFVIIAMLVVCALFALIVIAGISVLAEGRLLDADCYMWLMRAKALWESGAWYNSIVTATNAPYGELLHWSRPFDVLILGGAAVGSLFTTFDQALWSWGLVVSPVLLLLAVPIWSWGTRPILSEAQFVLSACMLFLLWHIGLAFAPARPDHHSLLGLLFFLVLSCLLRLATTGDSPGIALLAGAATGLALWTSVEALILLAFSITVFGIFWIVGWHARAGLMLRFLLAMLLVVALGISLEYPPDSWLTERYTQLAIPHLFVVLCMVIAALVMTRMHDHCITWKSRTVVAALSGLGVLLAIKWIYPSFFAGPWVDYDIEMIKEWLPMISEYKSLYPDDGRGMGLFIIAVGPILFAIGWCLVSLAKHKCHFSLVLIIGIAFYLPLGLMDKRWLYYSQILSIVPWVLLITSSWRWAESLSRMTFRIPARLGVIVLIVFGPIYVGGGMLTFIPDAKAGSNGACEWVDMANHLNQAVSPGSIIMTHTFKGPEIAWWGNVRVVGSPYGHNNIKETWQFFRTNDDQVARNIIEQREVDYVLICASGKESQPLGFEDPESLYSELERQENKNWLIPVEIPQRLQAFKLFHVVP